MMNDWTKTGIFAGVAVILAGIAFWVYQSSMPDTDVIAQRIGQPFFGEFSDISQAKAIRVVNPSVKGQERAIKLEYADGLWRIPSHNDYPAEDSARLGKAVALLLGLQRQAVVSRDLQKQKNYHVKDPLDKNANPDDAGTRLTVWDDTGNIIADLIIGDKVVIEEGSREYVTDQTNSASQYYVRIPDEEETYQVSLSPDLSYKFSDWINPDLLQIGSAEIKEIEFENYQIKLAVIEQNGEQYQIPVKDAVVKHTLEKDLDDTSWKYAALNPETEQVNDQTLQKITDSIAQFKIVDVLPKLEIEGKLVIDPQLQIENIRPEWRNIAQRELKEFGFSFVSRDTSTSRLTVASTEGNGELKVGTSDGVMYTMYFGEDFVGSTDSDENENADQQDLENKEVKEINEGDQTDSSSSQRNSNLNRYVMIKVEFDQSLIGPPPVQPSPPTEPKKPAILDQADRFNTNASDLPPIPPQVKRVSPIEEIEKQYQKELAQFDSEKLEYSAAKARFEAEMESYNQSVNDGKEKVAELNERFGQWFYVVDVDQLKDLEIKRETLVMAKQDENSNVGEPGLNSIPNLNFPPGMMNLNEQAPNK
jgi:hypothetical protein